MCVKLVNRILLGLLMLIPGIIKLFVFEPSGVTGMLTQMGFPLPMFFAWLLIISEIVFGLAILAKWKMEYTAWPPVIILIVAILVTTPWSTPSNIQVPSLLLHLIALWGYVSLTKCCWCGSCDSNPEKVMKSDMSKKKKAR